jgi:hypothetical protein
MARPKADFEKRTYNVILSKDVYEWLQKRAHNERRSGAAIVRDVLKREMNISAAERAALGEGK